jgi:alpha/beta superfamily hydrolase
MHGNAGNKFEGESYVPIVLPNGMDLFAFDFSGCGNSQGDFVTLGWKEQEDLKAVL